jgi:lipoate-protein ligase A
VPETWFHLDTGPGAAAFNMALDEALLEAAPQFGRPVLRFYRWAEPAASFGYLQRFADAARLTALRPLVRRPTGGGLVPHDADWTYSLVFPPAHAWHALRAAASYRQLHEWLRAALARLGVTTALSPDRRKEIPGHCFAGPEEADLLWQGRKLAGAAQRRSRSGLLLQGSVQPPPGLDRAGWEHAVRDAARALWGIEWAAWEISPALAARARALAATKYARDEFTRRR